MLAERLLDGEAEAMLRSVIEKAKQGDLLPRYRCQSSSSAGRKIQGWPKLIPLPERFSARLFHSAARFRQRFAMSTRSNITPFPPRSRNVLRSAKSRQLIKRLWKTGRSARPTRKLRSATRGQTHRVSGAAAVVLSARHSCCGLHELDPTNCRSLQICSCSVVNHSSTIKSLETYYPKRPIQATVAISATAKPANGKTRFSRVNMTPTPDSPRPLPSLGRPR